MAALAFHVARKLATCGEHERNVALHAKISKEVTNGPSGQQNKNARGIAKPVEFDAFVIYRITPSFDNRWAQNRCLFWHVANALTLPRSQGHYKLTPKTTKKWRCQADPVSYSYHASLHKCHVTQTLSLQICGEFYCLSCFEFLILKNSTPLWTMKWTCAIHSCQLS